MAPTPHLTRRLPFYRSDARKVCRYLEAGVRGVGAGPGLGGWGGEMCYKQPSREVPTDKRQSFKQLMGFQNLSPFFPPALGVNIYQRSFDFEINI